MYLPLLPASFVFPAIAWLFFCVYLPEHVENPFSSMLGWMHVAFALYMLANAAFNYYAAAFTCPGYPQHQDEFRRDRNFVMSYEMCAKCYRIRTAGSHHCSWCNTCVQMMCHHCPFTNNCTGLQNFVYYYSFLGYASFGLLYASYLSFFPFKNCAYSLVLDMVSMPQMYSALHRYSQKRVQLYKAFNDFKVNENCSEIQAYSLLFAPAVGVFCFIAVLFTFQTLLLLADMSMVDFYDTIYKSTSIKEFFRVMHVSICKRRKFRFNKMILVKKSKWWRFFLPCFVDVTPEEPCKDF